MMEKVYIPSREQIHTSHMYDFIKYLRDNHGLHFTSYIQLQTWSVTDNKMFWEVLLRYSGIKLHQPYSKVLTSEKMFLSKWFGDAQLNFAENLLCHKGEADAIVSYREGADPVRISYDLLFTLTAKVSSSLKKMGLKKGDRVAAVISNIPEAVISMLAVTSIGGIWSSCSPEFGEAGIMERFEQINPKFLIATEAYSYNGKNFDCQEKIRSIASKIESVEKLIWVGRYFVPSAEKINTEEIISADKELRFTQLLQNTQETIQFESVAFNDPVYIMYSSGTTGKPKCIVHGAGGTLLQHYKELLLHADLHPNDKILFYTTCGWMMWNWLVSGLMSGSAIYLYDGNPVYPETGTLWSIAQKEKLTHLGISPKFLQLCKEKSYSTKDGEGLENLRTILSTGAPLPADAYHYIYDNIKQDVQISSISGGTDIISCFMLGNPLSPVFPGELQGAGLGMSVEVWDDSGKPALFEKGELVCTKSFPSMPIYFMNDPENDKYKNSYFGDFPDTWKHGDFIQQTAAGGYVVFGRSDTTLNPGGVRIGTAEIYKVVENFPGVKEAVAAGKNRGSDVEIVLFLVLDAATLMTEEFKKELKSTVKTQLTPRHIPAHIFAVSDIPRTINGKKVEVTVTRIINGNDVKNKESIMNDSCLAEFYQIAEMLK